MNANAVADVIARAQHAVARARRLTESYQNRLESLEPHSSSTPITPALQQLASTAALHGDHPSCLLPSTPAAAREEHDDSTENQSKAHSPAQHVHIVPAAAEHQLEGDASTSAASEQASSPPSAMEALVERLVSMPLLSASHKLAQLHNQQASTLRQLLELRADQLR